MKYKLLRVFDLGFGRSIDVAEPKRTQPSDIGVLGVGFIGLASLTFGLALLGLALLISLATIVHFLRQQKNPTYWEIACWALVALGIVAHQVILPTGRFDLGGASLSMFGVAAIISLAVFPILMRLLNRLSPGPGLDKVAVPFALGFFLDRGQVLLSHYMIKLPWVT